MDRPTHERIPPRSQLGQIRPNKKINMYTYVYVHIHVYVYMYIRVGMGIFVCMHITEKNPKTEQYTQQCNTMPMAQITIQPLTLTMMNSSHTIMAKP